MNVRTNLGNERARDEKWKMRANGEKTNIRDGGWKGLVWLKQRHLFIGLLCTKIKKT